MNPAPKRRTDLAAQQQRIRAEYATKCAMDAWEQRCATWQNQPGYLASLFQADEAAYGTRIPQKH